MRDAQLLLKPITSYPHGMSFSKRLKEERERAGFSKGDLANMVGMHYSQIGRYERGEASPSSDVLKRLALALDTTADYLMSGTRIDLAQDTIKDKKLINLFNRIGELDNKSKDVVIALIEAFLFQQETKSRLGK
jgi:transcriptional regulator with XRE-family HTH domain